MARTRRRLDRGHRQPSIYSRTEQQEKSKTNWFKPFIIALLLLALVYCMFFTQLFSIKKIEVNDLRFADKGKVIQEIENYRKKFPFSLNNNILIFQSGFLSNRIGEIEGIKSVRIIKYYPSSVKVEITEKTPAFVWQSIEKKYIIDEKGIVVESFTEKFKDYPVVVDTKNVPVSVGTKIVDSGFAAFVSQLSADFNSNTNSKIAKMEVPEITSELKVTSDQGWYVLFDTTATAKNQLINLNRVLQEAAAKSKRLEYVDLRVGNRIFYK